jgi:hypothetical protein
LTSRAKKKRLRDEIGNRYRAGERHKRSRRPNAKEGISEWLKALTPSINALWSPLERPAKGTLRNLIRDELKFLQNAQKNIQTHGKTHGK